MLGYIIKRLLLMFVVILGVTVMAFSLTHFAPGDPALMIALSRYEHQIITEEIIEEVRAQEGLDAPIYIQYARWLGHVLHGDLGCSLGSGDPVLEEISARFPASLKLVIASMILSLIVAIPLGIISATKPHSIIDKLVMVGVVGGISMPVFWLAPLLILLFSIHLHLLPVCGCDSIKHLVLPAIALGAGMAAFTTMITRSSMLEVLSQDYIRAARAKGLSERVVIGKHALKNALIPVITVVGWQLMMALQGVVMVEMIFAWPGVGGLMVKAALGRDFPMIQGCVLLFGATCTVINLVTDISYAYLDPRIRYEKA